MPNLQQSEPLRKIVLVTLLIVLVVVICNWRNGKSEVTFFAEALDLDVGYIATAAAEIVTYG